MNDQYFDEIADAAKEIEKNSYLQSIEMYPDDLSHDKNVIRILCIHLAIAEKLFENFSAEYAKLLRSYWKICKQ